MRKLILCLILSFGAGSGAPAETVPESAGEISLSFAPVVRETAPAVVNIYARQQVADRTHPFAGDPFFDQFFQGMGGPTRVENSLGSGVILSEDGLVVTNYHVVTDATDIRVVLADRREYAARVLLIDQQSDVGVSGA